MAEYAGVAVGGLSMLFLSKRGNQARKVSSCFFVYCLQQGEKREVECATRLQGFAVAIILTIGRWCQSKVLNVSPFSTRE